MPALGLVMAILDYGNTLYSGLPHSELNKLQRIHNYAAKTILGRNRIDSAMLAGY